MIVPPALGGTVGGGTEAVGVAGGQDSTMTDVVGVVQVEAAVQVMGVAAVFLG